MKDVLRRWNRLRPDEAARQIQPCCGSRAWAREMAARRPIQNESALLGACDEVWNSLTKSDWMEAFGSHPRIGEVHSPPNGRTRSSAWSEEEQRKAGRASGGVKVRLAEANRAYEQRFHRTFIICAAGKSGREILETLRRRLRSDEMTELNEAAEQQRQIAHLRLKKWLA